MFHQPPPRHRIARLLRVASIVALAIFIVRPTSLGGQVIVASSEHSSIRGTINGGGNFVKNDPAGATPEVQQFHGQGSSVSFDRTGTKFAVEVGYNGVSASLGRPVSSPMQYPRAAPAGWDLTGTWLDENNAVYIVTQSGSTVTWSAHSADNRQWGHNFTGTINGDIVEGDFQDVPPYIYRNSGHIKLRIVDATHMALVSGPSGAKSWTRQTPVPPSVITTPPVPTAPPPAPAREPTFNVPARIFGVTAAHAVSAGRPVGATDAFTPDDGPIYVWFQHEGCPAGTIVKSDWYFLGVDPPMHIGDATATIGSVGNWGQFNLELAPGKRWPAGDYRVDLSISNTVAATTGFRVASSGAGNEPRVYRHPSAGYQLVVPSGWSLSEDAAPADVRLKARDGGGMIEITSGPESVRLDPVSYAAGWESRAVGPMQVLRVKRAGRALDVDGQPAYAGTYEGADAMTKVVFVSYPDRFLVLTGTFVKDSFAAGEALFDRLIESFRGR